MNVIGPSSRRARGQADPQRIDDDHRDPARGLSAADLAAALGVSEETVRAREHAGELFSVVRPARGCGREYPEFQAWKEIAGEPLKKVLQALDHPKGPAAYAFFTSPQETLAGLAPVDVLAKRPAHSTEHDDVLNRPNEERLAMVIAAARSFAATLAC